MQKFSFSKIEEAQSVLSMLSFKQLLELHDYIEEDYESLSNKLFEQAEGTDEYDYWESEEYDGGVSELLEKIKELLVEKAIREKMALEVIKRTSLHDELIDSAEDFIEFKDFAISDSSCDEKNKFTSFPKVHSLE